MENTEKKEQMIQS